MHARPDPASGSPARLSLPRRLWAYQAERFPLLGFVPLITLFTVASAGFSRIARHATGMVSPELLAIGSWTSLVCFFVLRVLDEHKDAEDDRRFRPELPVPRGLVTLEELRGIASVLVASVVLLHVWRFPAALVLLLFIATWAALMTREFFVRSWLRAHPAAYLLTHMAIMPIIDAYTTGLDWLPVGSHPPVAVLGFLAVTFCNGVLIELGRKLRAPGDEREGVDTYTHAWGTRIAPLVWLITLALSTALSLQAARAVAWSGAITIVFVVLALLAALPASWFASRPARSSARIVEGVSQLWPALTYVALGILPLLGRVPERP